MYIKTIITYIENNRPMTLDTSILFKTLHNCKSTLNFKQMQWMAQEDIYFYIVNPNSVNLLYVISFQRTLRQVQQIITPSQEALSIEVDRNNVNATLYPKSLTHSIEVKGQITVVFPESQRSIRSPSTMINSAQDICNFFPFLTLSIQRISSRGYLSSVR